jgi:hypothetical protein
MAAFSASALAAVLAAPFILYAVGEDADMLLFPRSMNVNGFAPFALSTPPTVEMVTPTVGEKLLADRPFPVHSDE